MKWFQKLVNVTLDLMHILTKWNCSNFSLNFSFSFQATYNKCFKAGVKNLQNKFKHIALRI